MISDGQQDLFTNKTSGKLQTDVDITSEILQSEEDYVKLFKWLNDRSSIKQDTLLNSYFKIKKEKGKDKYPYRWNYVEDKEYPCNETRAAILAGLEKCNISEEFLTHENEMALWHILYSVEDKIEIGKAMRTFSEKNNLNESFAEVFCRMKPFKKEYGSYSGTVTFGVTVASVSSLNASGRKTYGVPDSITKGVVVISVAEGGSSDGVLKPNDIIIKTGDTPIEDSNDLALILQGKKIGDTLPLTVYRNGSYVDVVITFKRNTTN
jgi:hypothetical protein